MLRVYAIINSILMTYGGSKYGAETIQYGGSFTLGSHAGIMEVNQNIASVAGNMILFIPFIAAGLMWGVRSFTSLATSMLSTPMQSAQEAAREASTGNISLGNVSVGNMNYDNITGNKLNDSVSIDTGRQQAVLSGGGVVQMTGGGKTTLDLSNAYTRNPGFETSYFDNQSSQLSEAATHSQNSGVTNAIQSSESRGKGIDAYAQAVLNHGKQSNWSDGYSKNITSDQREALQQYESAVNDWAKNHNMSKEDTVKLFATASSPFKSLIGIGAGAEGSKTSGERGSIDEAKKYMESRNFEQNRSIVEGLAKTQSFSEVDSEGSNLNLTIGEAFRDSAYYDKQARASFDEAESLRKEAQLIETKGSNIKVDTQQPFLEYLTTKRDSFGDQLTMKRASEILSSNQYTSPQDYAIREREYTTFMQKYGGNFVNKYKGDADNVIQDQGAFDNKIDKNYTDTSYIDYKTRKKSKELDRVFSSKKGDDGCFGLILHNSLAVTTEGIPLGLLNQQCTRRESILHPDRKMPTKQHVHTKPIEGKESYRWIEAINKTNDLEINNEQIHIADRESDIYELYRDCNKNNINFVIRARLNRVINKKSRRDKTKEKLFEYFESLAIMLNTTIKLQVNNEKKYRTADLSISFGKFTLPAPADRTKNKDGNSLENILLWGIFVREKNPPANEEGVSWFLITNIPINKDEEAIEKIKWYTLRWNIEVFHKILKSGCSIENAQLRSREKLIKYITAKSIIAWKIFWLSRNLEFNKNINCSPVLNSTEQNILFKRFNQGREIDRTISLYEALIWIAKLGGYIGRKSDSLPGIISIWRGWTRFREMVEDYEILSGKSYG